MRQKTRTLIPGGPGYIYAILLFLYQNSSSFVKGWSSLFNALSPTCTCDSSKMHGHCCRKSRSLGKAITRKHQNDSAQAVARPRCRLSSRHPRIGYLLRDGAGFAGLLPRTGSHVSRERHPATRKTAHRRRSRAASMRPATSRASSTILAFPDTIFSSRGKSSNVVCDMRRLPSRMTPSSWYAAHQSSSRTNAGTHRWISS